MGSHIHQFHLQSSKDSKDSTMIRFASSLEHASIVRGETFDVSFDMMTSDEDETTPKTMMLRASLAYEKETSSELDRILSVIAARSTSENGRTSQHPEEAKTREDERLCFTLVRGKNQTVDFRIDESNLQHEGKRFVLKITTLAIGDETMKPSAKATIVSVPFRVHTHRFRLMNALPSDWHNQSGGRTLNMLELRVFVTPIPGRTSPEERPKAGTSHSLKLSLYYEDFTEVSNQDILRVVRVKHTTQRVLGYGDDVNVTVVRCRIEQVSQRHGHKNRRFVIRVEADPADDPFAPFKIASVWSTPVRVWSKRRRSDRKNVGSKTTEKRQKVATTKTVDGLDSNDAQFENECVLVPPSLRRIGSNAKRSVRRMKSDDADDRMDLCLERVKRWSHHANELLTMLQWCRTGVSLAGPNWKANMAWPIFRCPSCFSFRDCLREQSHDSQCVLREMMRLYTEYVPDSLEALGKPVSPRSAEKEDHDESKTSKSLEPVTTKRLRSIDDDSSTALLSRLRPGSRSSTVSSTPIPVPVLPPPLMTTRSLSRECSLDESGVFRFSSANSFATTPRWENSGVRPRLSSSDLTPPFSGDDRSRLSAISSIGLTDITPFSQRLALFRSVSNSSLPPLVRDRSGSFDLSRFTSMEMYQTTINEIGSHASRDLFAVNSDESGDESSGCGDEERGSTSP